MGRLIAHVGVTVDGYIDDDAGNPVFRYGDDRFQGHLDSLLESIDGMVLGRRAYEQLASYWPTAGDEAPPVQVRRMHELPKYVLTRGELPVAWHNARTLGPAPGPALADLRARSERVAVFAGAETVRFAWGTGLLDELHLALHPSVEAGRTRLFDEGTAGGGLVLEDARSFPSGIVVLTYAVAGR